MLKKAFILVNIFFSVLYFFNPVSVYAENDKLIKDTLLLDIQTSNYYDLVIWADKLDLTYSGNIDDIRKVLLIHYNLEISSQNTELQSGRSIIIKSARELNYIDDITIDQNYIILQGDVVLEMIDYDNNTSHKINADKIIFNETEKTIDASGNIIYEIVRAEDNEYFYGKSLVFEIESWEGIFFEGVSETDRLIVNSELSSSENIKFFFSGESIYRGSGDRIELNKGTITSSNLDDPYYRIDADKIWILEPGEWAVKNAVLYVGRIPVFYFPFFFLPGDELMFNPTVGYKDFEGYFFNTTSYLIGLKEEGTDETFSFLKSENENQSQKEQFREGLFLRTSEKDLNTELWPYNNGSFLKLYVDYYSKKGMFVGLDGKLNFDSFLNKINFFTALSYSRYVYYDKLTNAYTPLRKDSTDSYVSDYEKTYFFGLLMPFRFAFDIDMSFKNDWSTLNIDLPVYSDSKFRANFLNREEGLKWTELINNDEKSINNTENEISTLSWFINGTITPNIESLSSFIDNFSINKINVNLKWLSRVSDSPDINTDYIYDDPFSFYYPSSLILPEISGNISGTFFQTQDQIISLLDNNLTVDEESLLKDPFEEDIKHIPLIDSDSLMETPVLLDYFPIELTKQTNVFSNVLKYSIIPSFSIDSIFNSDIPLTENDIDYTSDYSIFSGQTTSSLDYSLNIFDSFFDFSNISILSMNYKEHFNPVNQSAVWDSYILQDNNATNYKLTDKITIVSMPFIDSVKINETAFTYNLNTTLYNKYWNTLEGQFQDNYFLWNKESITDHRASLEIKINNSDNYQILKLDTVLPPHNIELYPEIIFHQGNVTGSLKTEFNYIKDLPKDYWIYKPYEGYIQYDFFEKDFFKQTLSLDLENMSNSFVRTELFLDKVNSNILFTENLDFNLDNFSLKKSSTDINLWFINFNYLMEDINGYYFEISNGWLAESVSKFQPSKASAGIQYEYVPDPFWKNRFKVSLGINSTWTMNLQKYTDTAFTFDLDFSLFVAEFLELSFKSKSVNRATYRYFPGNSDEIGLPEINIFSDLLKSFNFFSEDDRKISNFNLESISISAIHHLSEWDLNIDYTGEPVLVTVDNFTEYQWKSQFSLFVTWRPVPEIQKNIDYFENEIVFN